MTESMIEIRDRIVSKPPSPKKVVEKEPEPEKPKVKVFGKSEEDLKLIKELMIYQQALDA